ncbi:hypothetical protein WMY93_000655 [Mugilogobius chulae]|uniref:Uncharacterized protein n=1 Tax=Mugilogobius chulae TaxID=88201 RepID=A0AAW0Q320_9GOBI
MDPVEELKSENSDPFDIFHYTGGVAYLDNKGPFRERLEFVERGLLRQRDLHLRRQEPARHVGRPSSVRLLVFEKGEGPNTSREKERGTILAPLAPTSGRAAAVQGN